MGFLPLKYLWQTLHSKTNSYIATSAGTRKYEKSRMVMFRNQIFYGEILKSFLLLHHKLYFINNFLAATPSFACSSLVVF